MTSYRILIHLESIIFFVQETAQLVEHSIEKMLASHVGEEDIHDDVSQGQ